MATSEIGSRAHKAFLVDGSLSRQGSDVRVAGGQVTGYPATGNKRLPEGAVVVKETGDGLYYLASAADGAAAGDLNTPAIVTSAEKPDNDWKSKTLTWEVNYGGQTFGGTVAAGTGDNAIAAWVILLEADKAFSNHLVSSDAGASDLLVITTLAKGRVQLKVSMDLDTAFDSDDGATSSDTARGAEADYRVVTRQADLIDLDGDDRDSSLLPTLLRGAFRRSELSFLSNEAESVLIGRGSTFE